METAKVLKGNGKNTEYKEIRIYFNRFTVVLMKNIKRPFRKLYNPINSAGGGYR
jgi:hypothetical protein